MEVTDVDNALKLDKDEDDDIANIINFVNEMKDEKVFFEREVEKKST